MNLPSLYRLGSSDFIKGLLTAVVAGAAVAVGTVINSTFSAPGFDVFSVDWGAVAHSAINTAIIGAEAGFSGYLVKNLFTDENGNIPVLGKFGQFNTGK